MKITTTVDIDFDTWVNQASRFTRGDDNLNTRNIPENTLTSGKAEIHVELLKPLIEGFSANIKYVQNFTVQEESFVINNETSLTESIGLVDKPKSLEVISYKKEVPYDDVNIMLQEIDALLDAKMSGLERLKAQVMKGVVLDIVGHSSFMGLTEDQYIIEY
ncbi:hypothetical protein Harreka1_14 [Olleya phage Harreka_1]|uniref:Uncharacterized protein n=1 Tax=Olleya phage Harreka_1 TaxID=2745673 RepID=A0A8E4ZJT8_9CAUD|nr:hypothetical protein M1M26_gp14 [Olleya phage Harreka_1]QQV90421.1 hypothetical protein Harreka1_14 [Olleya phage Harreka_1]